MALYKNRMEMKLKESENWLSITLGSVGDAVIATDNKGIVKMVNSVAEALTGWKNADATGKKIDEVFIIKNEQTGKRVRNPINKVLKEGLTIGLRNHTLLITKDGKEIPIEDSAAPIKDDKGKTRGVVLVFRDDSKRRLAEKALLASESFNRGLVESSPVGILYLDKDGTIRYENPAMSKLMGVPEGIVSPVIGKKICDLETIKESGAAPSLESLLQGKPISGEVFKYRSLMGPVMDLEVYAVPLKGDDGSITGAILNAKDISDQKLKEVQLVESKEYLRISEEKFRDIYTWSPVGIYQSEESGRIITANLSFAEMLGYESPDDLINSVGMKDIYLNKNDRKKFIDQYDKSGTGSVANLEIQWKKKDNTVIWALLTAHAIRDQIGRTQYYEGFVVDITGRKKAEEDLRESEIRYRNLIENAPDVIYSLAEDGSFASLNPAFKRITGWSCSEWLGKPFMTLIHPSDLPLAIETFKQSLGGKKQPPYELRVLSKSGEYLVGEFTSTPLIEKGKVVGEFGIARDITDRQKQDQIQKALYNISQAGIAAESLELFMAEIQKELNTIIDTTNFYIAFYDESTDSIFMPFMADQKDRFTTYPAAKTMTKYMMESQKPILATKDDMLALQKSGHIDIHGTLSEIWLGVPLKSHGKVTGALVVQSYEDVNAYGKPEMTIIEFISDQISLSIERRKAKEEIKAALEKAQESDRLKSAFLATMSHELRTPLNAVIGFSQLIDAETPPDEVVMMTQRIYKSGEHLLSIIEDMFDVTMIESGQVSVKKENFYILPFMENIYKMLKIEQGRAKKEEIEIVFQGEPENRDFLIFTDKFKLSQILMNLLKNALKFTHEGLIEYGYILESRQEKPVLKFFIKDTGIGIPEEIQGVIFDLFRQVDDSHTRQYSGTGIGLSVAKKLTEILGGEIRVDSKEGEGSTFYFTIPYLGEKTIRPAESFIVSSQKKPSFPGKTILIVEDDDSSFEYLQIVLKKLQLIILWAKNGIEAIELSKSNPEIDLVLMDVKMPGMSGYEATKQIKKIRPGLPIIAQTAYALYKDKEKSEEAGCDDYITKPIQKELLMKFLEKYLIKN